MTKKKNVEKQEHEFKTIEKKVVEEPKISRSTISNGVSKRYVSYEERLLKRIFVMLILIAIGVGSFFMIGQGREPMTITYTERGDLEFRVFLEENDFFEEPYLTEGMQFIAALIDHVDITFNYIFDASDYLDYRFSYRVDAEVVVFQRNNTANVIWQRDINIMQTEVFDASVTRNIVINENIQLGYNEYNDLVRAFKTAYNLPADSHIILTFSVDIEAEHENIEEAIIKNSQLSMTIPLSEQMVDIQLTYNNINDTRTFSGTIGRETIDYVIIGTGVLAGLLLIITFIRFLAFVNVSSGRSSVYQKTLKNILVEYDRVIVEAKRAVAIPENANLIEVKAFEELLDVSDKIGQPILFMEIHRNQKCWFIIRNGEDVYRFILKSADLE